LCLYYVVEVSDAVWLSKGGWVARGGVGGRGEQLDSAPDPANLGRSTFNGADDRGLRESASPRRKNSWPRQRLRLSDGDLSRGFTPRPIGPQAIVHVGVGAAKNLERYGERQARDARWDHQGSANQRTFEAVEARHPLRGRTSADDLGPTPRIEQVRRALSALAHHDFCGFVCCCVFCGSSPLVV